MKKRTIFIIHLIYWFRLIGNIIPIITVTGSPGASTDSVRIVVFSMWINFMTQFIMLFPFYSAYFFLFTKYFIQKKYLQFGTGMILILFLTFFIKEAAYAIIKPAFNDIMNLSVYSDIIKRLYPPIHLRFANLVIPSIGYIISGCLLRAFVLWFKDRKIKEQLEKKNLQTELALLRAQINPHFLFNTLNNIDMLIEKQPARASEYLNKLSDIMRFTIYDAASEEIPLEEELEYIKKYIDLQRIRSSNPGFVKLEVIGTPLKLKIAPMLFIPFIENAFKHSTDKKQEGAIEIVIRIIGEELYFSCTNLMDKTPGLEKPRGGAGLDIIKSRLALIYPDHILHIERTDQRYIVNLNVKLNEN